MGTFAQHIDRIKSTKASIDKLAAEISDKNIAAASLACLWESFFDILFNEEGITISDLNTLTGVIQKLISSDNQINEKSSTLQSVLSEHELAIERLRTMKLSAKNIKRLEEQLRLL